MTDILLDSNGDLKLDEATGFAYGNSDGQHQELLLVLEKGEVKENPNATVGIMNYLNESEIEGMAFEIRIRFENDGMQVSSVKFNEQTGELNYDANYRS